MPIVQYNLEAFLAPILEGGLLCWGRTGFVLQFGGCGAHDGRAAMATVEPGVTFGWLFPTTIQCNTVPSIPLIRIYSFEAG